ncbi:MAG: S8 family serine peptidase, partial [Pseudomonadota bacterium]
ALRSPGFNWQTMLSLALASKHSYKDKRDFQRVIQSGWNVEITAAVNIADTQGYLLESDHIALLVYRGTESIGDWLINFDILDEDGAFGEVHSGFREAFLSTQSVIVPKLQAASSAGKMIWLTGHSLGGAIALNAAIETFGSVTLSGLATFGQPRIARSATARRINQSIGASYFRFVNGDDVVPRVPKTYFHAGQLFQFDGKGNLEESAAESTVEGEMPEGRPPLEDWELENLRAELKAIKADMSDIEDIEGGLGDFFTSSIEGLFPSISDHMIDRYIEAIKRFAPRDTSLRIEAESIFAQTGRPNEFSDGPPDFVGDPFEREFEISGDFPLDAELALPDLMTGGIPPIPMARPASRGAPFPEAAFESPEEAVEEAGAEEDAGAEEEATEEAAPVETPVGFETPLIPVLLEVSRNWQPPADLEVSSRFQNIATVRATEEQIKALSNDNDVSFMELSRDAGMVELDASLPFVGGDAVHAPAIDERGDAAIVGVVDTGIDILHNAFMNHDLTGTRIIGLWDQRDPTGPTPKAVDPTVFTQDYGTLHTKAAIDDAIQKHRNRVTPVPSRLRDPRAHGTHVASIAAGRATGSLSAGMAPEANILVVAPNMKQEAGSPPSIGYSNSHVDALYFLTSAAAGNNALVANGMPIAINVSLGMNAGAHDGSTLLEAAFDAATNIGRDRGVVIVKSAGNERSHAGHASIQAAHGGVVELSWHSSEKFRPQDYFEGWFDAADDLSFVVVDPKGNRSSEIDVGTKTTSDILDGNICTMTLSEVHRDNAANRLTIKIVPQGREIQDGLWTLEVIGRNVQTETGMVNVWVERNSQRAVKFEVEDVRMTLSVPGTAQTVITVGATDTGTPWRLNDSSSFGPTRTGGKKPDLCAPGFQIKAARAARNDPDAAIAKTGTSMAAPHVTGAIALALSKIAKTPGKPMPNAKQVAMRLRLNVKGGVRLHHPGAGYGLLDAEAFFKAIT